MKAKKNISVNLEKKKFIFFEIGLLLSLTLCLMAFEWSSEKNNNTNIGKLDTTLAIDEDVLNTFTKETPPLTKKEIESEIIIEKIEIVDNNIKVDVIDFNSDVKDKNNIKIIFVEPDIIEDDLSVIEWVNVEEKPLFPGGDVALLKFISENTNYPEISKENLIEGKVFVRFVISETGEVKNASIIKGVDKYLDEEAIRVISSLPKWEPGKQRGKCVPVSFIIPINFKLM